jgi:hypothetical protein
MKRKARKVGVMAKADAKIVAPTMPYSKRG